MPKVKSKRSKSNPKENKLASKRSKNNSKTNQLTLRQQLWQLNVNEIDQNRTVEFVILNECLPRYFDDIEKFQNYAYTTTSLDVRPIIYEEILYIIRHYPAWDRPYLPNDIENMLKEVCVDAKTYLKSKKPIPLDVMAELIKLRVILLIKEDVYNENITLPQKQVSISFCESMVSEDIAESKDSTMVTKDHNVGSSVETPVVPVTDEYVHDTDTVDVFFTSCSLVLQEYMRVLKRAKSANMPKKRNSEGFVPTLSEKDLSHRKKEQYMTPWSIRHCRWLKTNTHSKHHIKSYISKENQSANPKLLYIVLTGFYDPLLIIYLNNIGLPLSCILNVATKGDKPNDPTAPFDIRMNTLVSPFSVVPVYHYSLQCLYALSKRPIKICDLNYDDMKAHLVFHFWNTLEELYVSHNAHLKDAICIMCPPVDIYCRYISPQSEEYEIQSAAIYKNISELLNKLKLFRELHQAYLHDLQVIDLGPTPECVPVDEMFYYNRVVNNVPIDCYTVDLTIEGLLKEVHKKSSRDNCSVCFFNEKEIDRVKKSKSFSSIKKFTQKIFNKYKFSYMPVNISTFYQKLRSRLPLRSAKIHEKPKKFEIYEGDNLELKAKYYPKYGKKLGDKALKQLKKSPPCLLWNLYSNIHSAATSTEIKFNTNQYHTWASLLRLSPEEVSERLEVYMFSLLKCYRGEERSLPVCGIHQFFPETERMDDTIYIDRDENWKRWDAAQKNIYEYHDENYFQWHENLSPSLLLQKLERCYNLYKCMDHVHIPFLDSILVKFHDKCDHFGTTSETWAKGLRSPVSLHDFYRSVIYEDAPWMCMFEQMFMPEVEKSLKTQREHSCAPLKELYNASDYSNIRLMSSMFTTMSESSYLRSPSLFLDKPFVGYNLSGRHDINGVSTTFHSLDGLKVTVDKQTQFTSNASISLKLEADDHIFFLYLSPKQEYTFDIIANNGIRFVFCKPEIPQRVGPSKTILIKKPTSKIKPFYSIKEIETIKFYKRESLYKLHFLNEISLINVLKEISPMDNFSSKETLKLLDSQKSIIFKSTVSMTDVRWRTRLSKEYLEVLRAIRGLKRTALPHFKIISTALHKFQYVKIAKSKIIVRFADGEKVFKYIPNLDVQKKIEISKCMLLKPKKDKCQTEENQTYDTRISLPNGLQISSRPSVQLGMRDIIQCHTLGNLNIVDEASRVFTHSGHIQIQYRDGSIKMIGIHGRCIIGEWPQASNMVTNPKKKKTRKVEYLRSPDEEALHKYMKLQKYVSRKVYHYQRKFIHVQGKNYLRNRRKNEDFNINNFMKFRHHAMNECELNVNEPQFLSAINFYIPEGSVYDYYTLDSATKDSHTSINDEGELTTIYADGTRITSWFTIDQEMIVINTDADGNSGQLELDADDYTCNFFIPRTDSWVSVQICYQFEHSQYATVRYIGKDETHICLPGKHEYRMKSDGNFFINLMDEFYVNINPEEIKLSTNYCKACYGGCETTICAKRQEDPEDVEDEILLETKDCFGKVFRVDFDGTCHRNDQLQSETVKECPAHRMDDTQKFFIFDKNFNGKMYWNGQKLQNKLTETMHKEYLNLKLYLDELDNLRVYDFIKYYYTHFCDRFLMQYCHPNPIIFGPPSTKSLIPVFTSKRQIRITQDYTKVLPLFTLIQDLRVKNPQELPLPHFETIFHLEKYLRPKRLESHSYSTESIHMKLPQMFADVAVENFTKLMKKAENFEIDKLQSDNNFQVKIADSEDTQLRTHEFSAPCAPGWTSGKVVHPKTLFHKILERKKKESLENQKSSTHERTSWKQSSFLVPPVPKNSVTINTFKIISKVSESHDSRMLSFTDFSKPSEKYFRLKKSHERCSQGKLEHEQLEHVTMLEDGIEWRKPTFQESDSSVTSTVDYIQNVDVKRKTKDEQVYTTTPFDLFLDERQPPIMEDAERIGPHEYSKKQFDKSQSVDDLRWHRFDKHGKVVKNTETQKIDSKQSKMITGVQAIESYNQVYDKFISLYKDIPKDMKRFTEVHRHIGEKQSLKRTKSQTLMSDAEQYPPMILPSTEIKTPLPKLTISVHEKQISKELSVIEATVKSRDFKPEAGVRSKTLERLSNETTRNSNLKIVPSAIDKKVQSKFKKNARGRSSLSHVSYENVVLYNKETSARVQSSNSDKVNINYPRKKSNP